MDNKAAAKPQTMTRVNDFNIYPAHGNNDAALALNTIGYYK
jgi:hypothetical protein